MLTTQVNQSLKMLVHHIQLALFLILHYHQQAVLFLQQQIQELALQLTALGNSLVMDLKRLIFVSHVTHGLKELMKTLSIMLQLHSVMLLHQ